MIYVIGDVQGCYNALQRLLEKIAFDSSHDQLWFAGDLICRGPDSLRTLRLIKKLGKSALSVLGNHDLHGIALYHGVAPMPCPPELKPLLAAADRDELFAWLQTLPLVHRQDPYLLVHAGVPPIWDFSQAHRYSDEVSAVLQSADAIELLKQMYGNTPSQWQDSLTGIPRLRYIINAFTRMRFCNPQGQLELDHKGPAEKAPEGFAPWFNHSPKFSGTVLFGHWAALEGVSNKPYAMALDGGCVWGKQLIAMRLEDGQRFTVECD